MGCILKGLSIVTVLTSIVIGSLIYVSKPSNQPPRAEYRQDHYWGKQSWKLGDAVPKDDVTLKPFKINVEPSFINDLKDRLRKTRLQDSFPGTNFEYGFRSDVLKEIIEYWANSYDWKKQQDYLNSFPQFKTQIEGLDVHFVHIKSTNPKATPIIMVHGWPGSYIELLKTIPKLKEHFEIIIPSLPGYGFSEASHKPGLHTYHFARIFKKLMNRLGHDKFMYHGGDWGAITGRSLARTFPESVIGLHTTMPTGPWTFTNVAKIFLANIGLGNLAFKDANEVARWVPIKEIFSVSMRESGFLHLQATKPDTIGVALNNDPAGLAAYILEKFSTATKRENINKADGGLKETFTMDELLTNVMIYWINGCGTSSARLYYEGLGPPNEDRGIVSVPTAVLVAKTEAPQVLSPSLIGESYPDVVKYTNLDRAGHFLAFEEPDIVAHDLHDFLKILKERKP